MCGTVDFQVLALDPVPMAGLLSHMRTLLVQIHVTALKPRA